MQSALAFIFINLKEDLSTTWDRVFEGEGCGFAGIGRNGAKSEDGGGAALPEMALWLGALAAAGAAAVTVHHVRRPAGFLLLAR